jgi:hypothetical protein
VHTFKWFERFVDRCKGLEYTPSTGLLLSPLNPDTVAYVCELLTEELNK